MEAIIKTGGKQYKVKAGQKVVVELLAGEPNAEVQLDSIARVNGDKLELGAGKVSAKIVRQFRGEKVISATYKRRKGFHKKKGHRQTLTEIEVTKV